MCHQCNSHIDCQEFSFIQQQITTTTRGECRAAPWKYQVEVWSWTGCKIFTKLLTKVRLPQSSPRKAQRSPLLLILAAIILFGIINHFYHSYLSDLYSFYICAVTNKFPDFIPKHEHPVHVLTLTSHCGHNKLWWFIPQEDAAQTFPSLSLRLCCDTLRMFREHHRWNTLEGSQKWSEELQEDPSRIS